MRLLLALLALAWIAPAAAQNRVGPVDYRALTACTGSNALQYDATSGLLPCKPFPFAGKIIDLRDITSTPCDGTTDMTSAIQSGVTQAAGNAMFYLPAYSGSACIVSSTISIGSGTRVWIDGILKLANGVANGAGAALPVLAVAANANNVDVGGYGIIDGNIANNPHGSGRLSGCFMTLGSATSNIWLHDLTIQNCKNWPVNFVGTTNAWMVDLILKDSGNSPEFAAGSNHCHARGLQISGIGDESFAFYGGVFLCSIEDSLIENLTGTGNVYGIAVLNDTSQPAPNHDIMIQHNTIHGMGQSGIAVNQGTGGGGDSYNILIDGNHIYGNGLNNTSGFCGIKLIGADYVTIRNNFIHNDGNTTTPSACYGIDATGMANDLHVTANLILNEGQGGTLGVGINVGANCSDCVFADNQIGDNQGTPTMAFAFDGTAGTRNRFMMNTSYGTVGLPYDIQFASDTAVNTPTALGYRGVTTPGDGGTVVAHNTDQTINIQNSGTLGSFTVTAAGFPPNHQQVTVICDSTITTLTFAPGAGQTVDAGTTSCGTGIPRSWIINGTEWHRVQ